MEEYLNKGIKDVIGEFPEIGKILDEYSIGCVSCGVGSCLLKDIVKIHNLSEDDEHTLMRRIAKAIYPEKDSEIPAIKRENGAKKAKIAYSPPMKKLVDEHVLIKRWAALIADIVKDIDLESMESRQLILDGVDFIRFYADRYHHAKEEDILFKYFDEDTDILRVMHEDHKAARGHAAAIIEALDRNDSKAVIRHLTAYAGLLTEHIKKEDEILYPWMDRNLTTTQVGELFSRFSDADSRIGVSTAKYEAFINSLEGKYN